MMFLSSAFLIRMQARKSSVLGIKSSFLTLLLMSYNTDCILLDVRSTKKWTKKNGMNVYRQQYTLRWVRYTNAQKRVAHSLPHATASSQYYFERCTMYMWGLRIHYEGPTCNFGILVCLFKLFRQKKAFKSSFGWVVVAVSI